MPAILTCTVGNPLCFKPEEDHWALRDVAAELVAYICDRFGSVYTNLRPRVSQTLHSAIFDTKKPVTTLYGVIKGKDISA